MFLLKYIFLWSRENVFGDRKIVGIETRFLGTEHFFGLEKTFFGSISVSGLDCLPRVLGVLGVQR